MAHDNFDDKPQPCVDERREHVFAEIESSAFEAFDQWMDVQLANLVDRWIKTAAPQAAQQRFWGKRFKAK
jgi:hypothetical protein